jgi:hypothetical protein
VVDTATRSVTASDDVSLVDVETAATVVTVKVGTSPGGLGGFIGDRPQDVGASTTGQTLYVVVCQTATTGEMVLALPILAESDARSCEPTVFSVTARSGGAARGLASRLLSGS